MLTIDELNLKLLSELKEIAGSLSIPDYAKLPKKEIINRILAQQEPAKPAESEAVASLDDEPKKKRARRTTPGEAAEGKPSAGSTWTADLAIEMPSVRLSSQQCDLS